MSRSFKILPGIKLNIGKKSISTTIGKRGVSVNTGTNGTFLNAGLPGTGIRYRKKLFKTKNRTTLKTKHLNSSQTQKNSIFEGAVILGFIIGGAIFLTCGSFVWSFVPIFLMPILCSLANKNKHQE